MIISITVILLILNWGTRIWLERLNVTYAESAAKENKNDTPHYSWEEKDKALAYLQGKSKLAYIDFTYGTVILALALFSGVLPFYFQYLDAVLGASIWSGSLILFSVPLIISASELPLDWYRQFVLEEKFGFNKTTQSLWWWDRFLGLMLAVILLYPLLVLILWIVTLIPDTWWLWVWAVLIGYQFMILIIAPNWIMPLFNTFSPLKDESLKQRLQDIAQQAGVEFESISEVDGSKRSTHLNAFLSGLGKYKKIALFDTLMEQLSEDEIVSVTAHELGHFKKKHILKRMLMMSVLLLVELYVMYQLIQQPWLFEAFGFEPGNIATGLLLISFLGGLVTFWLNPLENYISRKHEYEADAFAKELMNQSEPMITALQTIEKANLGNPTPHPLYSAFYYSHPTVQERVNALRSS